MTDFYKFAHQGQYDPSINKLVSYGTPRGCRLPGKDYVINFGIQSFCKEYLIEHFNQNFFSRSIESVTSELSDFLTNCFPGSDVSQTVNKISELHELGYIPISLRTIPEGSKVSLGCPNIEIVTTVPGFQWIGGFIESLISSYIWKPMICATVGHWYRETANKFFEMTADDWEPKARSSMSEFGFRGADTPEDGIHSGAAWLLSFDKTATCAAIPFVNEYYNTVFPGGITDVSSYLNAYLEEFGSEKTINDFIESNNVWHSTQSRDKEGGGYSTLLPLGYDKFPDWFIPDNIWNNHKLSIYRLMVRVDPMVGVHLVPFSVGVVGKGLISTEHSVMCSSTQLYMKEGLSQKEAEKKYVKRLLTEIYPNSSFSMVSDSYDYWRMITEILPELKNEILSRGKNDKSIDLTESINNRYNLIKSRPGNKGTDDLSWKLALSDELNEHSADEVETKCYFTKDKVTYGIRVVNKNDPNAKIPSRLIYPIVTPTLFVRGDSGDPVKIVAGYVDITDKLSQEDLDDILRGKATSLLSLPNRLIDDLNIQYLGKFISDYCYIRSNDGKLYRLNYDNIVIEFSLGKELPKHEAYGTVSMLAEIFGTTLNSKGYAVLDPHIRAIYGDSITPKRQEMIYAILKYKGLSVENVALGAGSFSFHAYQGEDGTLYPYTRDTYQFAQKATYGKTEDGSDVMIYKDPKTDSDHFKKSMKGCCAIYFDHEKKQYYLDHDGLTIEERDNDVDIQLLEVFNNGVMKHEDTFDIIRYRINNGNF